jgi:CheY-like chemotaxis protein
MICVLVVDDDLLLRQMAARLLEHAGYVAVPVGSAAEARAVLPTRPDITVALIDVLLPDMSGLDLAADLRRLAPGLRVAFMSGFSDDHFERPVDEPCVMKPFTMEELMKGIKEALDRSS